MDALPATLPIASGMGPDRSRNGGAGAMSTPLYLADTSNPPRLKFVDDPNTTQCSDSSGSVSHFDEMRNIARGFAGDGILDGEATNFSNFRGLAPATSDAISRGGSGPLVINISAGTSRPPNGGVLDAIGQFLSQDANFRQTWENEIRSIADSLQSSGRNDVIVVKSLGNEGANLTQSLRKLYSDPKLKPLFDSGRLRLVGSSGQPGRCLPEIDKGQLTDLGAGPSYSDPLTRDDGSPLVQFAPGRNVAVPGHDNCSSSGTSPATATVAGLALRAMTENPGEDPVLAAKQSLDDAGTFPGQICLQGEWVGSDVVSISDECGFSFSGDARLTFTVSGSGSKGTFAVAGTLPGFSYNRQPCGNLNTSTASVSGSGNYSSGGAVIQMSLGSAGSGTGSVNGNSLHITLNGTSANGSPVTNVLSLTKLP